MRCEDARERAELCYDQLLEPAEAREVDTHLRSCPECRVFGERERELQEALVATTSDRAPSGFDERVVDEIFERNRLPLWPIGVAVGVVAMAGLLLALPLLQDARSTIRVPAKTTTGVTPTAPSYAMPIANADPDQVERARSPRTERVRVLLDRADVIVHGVVIVDQVHTEDLALFPYAFLRGGPAQPASPLWMNGLRIHGIAQWKAQEEVVLFLERGGQASGLTVIRGMDGKQTGPIDGWLPLDTLKALARNRDPAQEDIRTLVAEQGVEVLARLDAVRPVAGLVDTKQVKRLRNQAVWAMKRQTGPAQLHAARQFSVATRFVDAGDLPPLDLMQSLQPVLEDAADAAKAGGESPVDRLGIIRATRDQDPEWARDALMRLVETDTARLAESRPGSLPEDFGGAVRLLAEVDREAATRQLRAFVATIPNNGVTRGLLQIGMDVDPEFGADEVVRRARMETWATRERVVVWYAPLLVRVDRPEARMLLRASLVQLADDTFRQDEFIEALAHEDAEPARTSLAAAFLEEAERFDNVTDRRQTFFLRCHVVCGGSLDDFAGWLPTLLERTEERYADRVALLRELDGLLGANLFEWKEPAPVEADAITAALLERLAR